jgi:hypothetical protein
MKFMAERLAQEARARPEPKWWTAAWDKLAELEGGDGVRITPVSPGDFKQIASEDVFIMDEIGVELGVDPVSGEPTDPSTDPDLIYMASAVVWNGQATTMVRKGMKGVDPNEVLLSQFEWAVKLVPQGCKMAYLTHSDWLMAQWTDMMEWKSLNYQGLDRDACPHQWKGIMGLWRRGQAACT